jgi:hypothetical protein
MHLAKVFHWYFLRSAKFMLFTLLVLSDSYSPLIMEVQYIGILGFYKNLADRLSCAREVHGYFCNIFINGHGFQIKRFI